MGHLNDGALRRLLDEPLAMNDRDRRHLESCERCRSARDGAAADAVAVGALFSVPPADVDSRAALSSVRRRVETLPAAGFVPRLAGPARFQFARHARPLAIAGLAAALVAAMTVTGTAGDAITGAVTIFRGTGTVTPVTVQTNTISRSDIAGLPDLSAYGTMTWQSKPETTSVDALTKAAAVGLAPINAGGTYQGMTPTYTFISQSKSTFKLDARMATAAATAKGKPAPTFGPGIDGSTLTVTGGPALVQTYGKLDPNAKVLPVVLAVSKTPVVTSSGVSVQQLEDFLVHQPGTTPAMAAAIQAIGNPIAAGELPIPIPAEYAKSKPAKVNGVYAGTGVIVNDNTGLASALIWQKGDTVHVVAGHLTDTELLSLAGSAGS